MDLQNTHILSAAAAGLLGGIAFGLLAWMAGMLPSIAGIVGASTATAGFITNLIISVIVGALFAILFGHMIASYTDGLAIGMVYGVAWWILGALILMPLFLGASLPIASISGITGAWPSLLMHLLYGAILGVGFVLFRPEADSVTHASREYREYEYRHT